jgi:hypothetical protein
VKPPPTGPGDPRPAPAPARTSRAGRSGKTFCLLFGLFLGFSLIKFANPVILDDRIPVPQGWREGWTQPWPLRWAHAPLLLFFAAALWLRPAMPKTPDRGLTRTLPWDALAWLLWQGVASLQSVDPRLTAQTLPHLAGLVACFWIGFRRIGPSPCRSWIWLGLAIALGINGVRAANQRWIEFPGDLAFLRDGDRQAWTHLKPSELEPLVEAGLVLLDGGSPKANPLILAKLEKARVHGTVVYPNALANLLLLLTPPLGALAWRHRHALRPRLRTVLLPLGGMGLIQTFWWTDSKAAWLVAMAVMGTAALWVLPVPRTARRVGVALVIVLGLGGFSLRYHGYLAAGATSASARFDYWRAALQATAESPWTGSGPGTFQRVYSRLKPPEAEMTRLVHNDYLQQFSDSGIPGGLLYLAWVGGVAWRVGTRTQAMTRDRGTRPHPGWDQQALALGLLAWALHGLFEFCLYVPALGWTAWTLAGIACHPCPDPAAEESKAP